MVSELHKLQKGLTMNSRVNKVIALSAVTLGICGILSGCSSSHYSYKTPNIDYTSVYLSLKVDEKELDKLEDVSSANIYAYNSSGVRVSYTSSAKPLLTKGRYSYSFFCAATAKNATIDFFNSKGDFIGCTTIALPELGKHLNEDVDINKLYDEKAALSSYTLKIRELSAEKVKGGNINLEAVLKTPNGEQFVTDNTYSIDWSSSDIGVIHSSGNGIFTVVDSGKATITVEYNGVFSDSKNYTIQ